MSARFVSVNVTGFAPVPICPLVTGEYGPPLVVDRLTIYELPPAGAGQLRPIDSQAPVAVTGFGAVIGA